ncbi:unnamed protein product [Caenorhabditis auriculariae]|uniref:RNA helicase n=1 Tax=Caenorhabditis auriculariae TaxID=2777116 RepID=A0A8S1HK06_9PELO|nr:unnamed protein product [Caenorhabditis auriculariae]
MVHGVMAIAARVNMSDSSDSEYEEETVANPRKKKFIREKSEDSEEERKKKAEKVEEEEEVPKSFAELGLNHTLCDACERLGWTTPSKIQASSLPFSLVGRDMIGLAETGSGKTGAFALPVLQALLNHPQAYFALVLTPTRELAFQIAQQFEALGSGIGLGVAVIVGGVDMATQAIGLAKRPHIIVATPGRLVDHLENTKGFNLKALKYLVMDEADRILNLDFEAELDKILKVIPRERRTYLFSATMTKKVAKLERASLKNPARIEVSTRYTTVDKLLQNYLFIPQKYKDPYLIFLLNEHSANTIIVFTATCNTAMLLALTLRQLGLEAVPLHGKMTQEKRLGSLNKFRSKARRILVCTDVASRGLDIPHVDMVINYDVPSQSKDYVHRVGRTARAGRAGLAITMVTQYDVETYQRVEGHLGKKMSEYDCNEQEVMLLAERTQEAIEAAKLEIKEMEEKKKRGQKRRAGDSDDDDTEEVQKAFNKRIGGKKRNGPGMAKLKKKKAR